MDQYFKRLQFYIESQSLQDKDKAVLLSCCGEKAFSLIETLLAPDDVTAADITFDRIKTVVLAHLRPKTILHFERHRLHSMMQISGEGAATFLQRLKDQSNKCEFGQLKDELTLCQFVFGLSDQSAREKLLAKADLTLTSAIQECLLLESVSAAARYSDTVVSAIQNKSTTSRGNVSRVDEIASRNSSDSNFLLATCYSCGRRGHRRTDCKFRNAICRTCGKPGHISTVCRSGNSTTVRHISQANFASPSHGVGDQKQSVSDANSPNVVLSVSSSSSVGSLWYKRLQVGSRKVDFLLDCGSQVTILPKDIFKSTGLELSTDAPPVIKAYGGSVIEVLGVINNVTISFESKSHTGKMLVTDVGSTPILGTDFLLPLGFVEFHTNPISCVNNCDFIASFRIKENASFDGMRFAARSLPFSMKSMVEDEIRRLLREDIIYPIANPVMSAPIVPVVKQAGARHPIRICGDYSMTLNKIIDPDSYQIPKLEEIAEKLSGAKVYSVLDLSDAYLQVALSEDSQKFTSISTHMGHFAYKRLQFGVSAAPLIFQEIMEKVLTGIPHNANYQDDIIIGAPDDHTHDETLSCVRARLQKHGFNINEDKSQIKRSEVKFLGFVFRNGKLVPDKDRLKTFSQLEMPTTKEQLRSLLGTIRHYGVFCQNFSSIARPLYSLLKLNAKWIWTDVHQTAVRTLLNRISSGEITCYDQGKPLYVFSDASKDGLGFVLSHDNRQREVVWLASRVLTPAESNNSNIEREALGVIEAVKYFHKFLAGRTFTICSDHQPLQFIFRKNSVPDRVSARLQRWSLTLRAYNYTVQYVRGDLMFAADTLSRIPQRNGGVTPMAPTVDLLEINYIQEFSERETLLRKIACSKDFCLTRLKNYIVHGWPSHLPSCMLPYSKTKEEYSIQNGVIFRGLRIVPPSDLRRRVLHLLHSDHPGITRMIRLARQYFWWPNIDADINAFVQRCATCQVHSRKRTTFNLSSWAETHSFLERVHVDVAYWQGHRFLVFVDSFSKWVDVQPLKDLSSAAVITALRHVFKYVGLPAVLVSDNGTNFASDEFSKFATDNYIQHVFTPPGHHASNGQAERVIQSLKLHLSKFSLTSNSAEELDRATISFCLHHNTTPSASGAVPNSFVFIKSLRTRLTVQCTETDLPTRVPVYIRAENKLPEPSALIAKHGSNTNFSETGRLVHDADATPMVKENVSGADDQTGEQGPKSEENALPDVRRSLRHRQAPERYGF